jgi:hypothetical protein
VNSFFLSFSFISFASLSGGIVVIL